MIRDSAGLVTQRVMATIVNIAADMRQQRVHAGRHRNRAVSLGLNYPRGPLALGNLYGPTTMLEVLFNLPNSLRRPPLPPEPVAAPPRRAGPEPACTKKNKNKKP